MLRKWKQANWVINMRLKRQSAVGDDTQTLNLMGGKDGGVVNINGKLVGFG